MAPFLRKQAVAGGRTSHRSAAGPIALWLGDEQERTTHVYLHADLELKQRTLDRMTPLRATQAVTEHPDTLLAFLEGL